MDQTCWEKDESLKFDAETPLWRAFGLGAKILQHCGVRMLLHALVFAHGGREGCRSCVSRMCMAIRLLPLLGAIGLGPVSKHVPNVLARHGLIQPSSRKTGKERVPCSANTAKIIRLALCCCESVSHETASRTLAAEYSNGQEMLWLSWNRFHPLKMVLVTSLSSHQHANKHYSSHPRSHKKNLKALTIAAHPTPNDPSTHPIASSLLETKASSGNVPLRPLGPQPFQIQHESFL